MSLLSAVLLGASNDEAAFLVGAALFQILGLLCCLVVIIGVPALIIFLIVKASSNSSAPPPGYPAAPPPMGHPAPQGPGWWQAADGLWYPPR